MFGWKSVVSIILIGFILKRLGFLLYRIQPMKVVYNHAPGPCQYISPIVNGSEDIQLIPNTQIAVISSGIKMPNMIQNPRIANSPGHIYMFDFNKPEEGAKVVPCNGFDDYGTAEFSPHGISILENEGRILLFVVNHPQKYIAVRDTVEKFEFDMEDLSLKYLKTYTSEHFRLSNDVVATGPETFYVSHLYYSRTSAMITLESLILQLEWCPLVLHDKGDSYIVADGMAMGNGIHTSPDNKYIYLYTGMDVSVRVYEKVVKDNKVTLSLIQKKEIPTTICDNIDVEPSSGDLWLTCHPVPHKTLRYMEAHDDKDRPLAPSQIKTKDGLLTDDIREVYANDGTEMEVSTIAVYDTKTSSMLIGSIDKNLLYCKVNCL